MKLKPLLPSLREKKRYIAFEVQTDSPISFEDAKKCIEQSMQKFLGDFGMAKAGVLFLKDWKNNRGIMRVDAKYTDATKASLALVKELNNRKAIIQSIKVSGVLDKIRSSCF